MPINSSSYTDKMYMSWMAIYWSDTERDSQRKLLDLSIILAPGNSKQWKGVPCVPFCIIEM